MLPPRLIRRLVLTPLVIVLAAGFIVLSAAVAPSGGRNRRTVRGLG